MLLFDTFSVAAPGVAVGWQLVVARAFRVHLPPLEPLVLALSVWSLYAADHALDALRAPTAAWEPNRRIFYRHHGPAMALLAAAGAISAVGLAICQLSAEVFRGGVALGAFVLAYLALVHCGPFSRRARWPREAIVAVGFAGGTFIPVAVCGRLPVKAILPAAILFFALCWLNCCVVETWECQRSGSATNAPHCSTQWIANHVSPAAASLCAAFLLLHGSSIYQREFAAVGVASGAALLLIAGFRDRFPLSFISVAVDLALWTPFIVLACS